LSKLYLKNWQNIKCANQYAIERNNLLKHYEGTLFVFNLDWRFQLGNMVVMYYSSEMSQETPITSSHDS